MSDIPVLISDLAIILFSAGLITILFKWLKQPVVLGYIMYYRGSLHVRWSNDHGCREHSYLG